jgi:nucleoside-diphosphate-sugar epimerase
VYGYNDEHVREAHPVSPINFYLASKYAAEVLLVPYRELLRTVVLRPFFVYGPGQRGMLVATLAERVLRGDEVTVDGNPGLRINPVHVEDAARAIEAAISLNGSDLVNVAGDEAVTVTELVGRLGAAAGVEPRIVHRGEGPAGDLLGDNTRMKAVLGVVPEIGLDAGLRDIVYELRG